MENKLLKFKKLIKNYYVSLIIFILTFTFSNCIYFGVTGIYKENIIDFENLIITLDGYIVDGYSIKYNGYLLDNINFFKIRNKGYLNMFFYIEPTYYINYTEKIIYFD